MEERKTRSPRVILVDNFKSQVEGAESRTKDWESEWIKWKETEAIKKDKKEKEEEDPDWNKDDQTREREDEEDSRSGSSIHSSR